jgi:hypothetical protein
MTITHGPDMQCKPNPSAGVSSIPLSSLQGAPAPAGTPPPTAAAPAKIRPRSLPENMRATEAVAGC